MAAVSALFSGLSDMDFPVQPLYSVCQGAPSAHGSSGAHLFCGIAGFPMGCLHSAYSQSRCLLHPDRRCGSVQWSHIPVCARGVYVRLPPSIWPAADSSSAAADKPKHDSAIPAAQCAVLHGNPLFSGRIWPGIWTGRRGQPVRHRSRHCLSPPFILCQLCLRYHSRTVSFHGRSSSDHSFLPECKMVSGRIRIRFTLNGRPLQIQLSDFRNRCPSLRALQWIAGQKALLLAPHVASSGMALGREAPDPDFGTMDRLLFAQWYLHGRLVGHGPAGRHPPWPWVVQRIYPRNLFHRRNGSAGPERHRSGQHQRHASGVADASQSHGLFLRPKKCYPMVRTTLSKSLAESGRAYSRIFPPSKMDGIPSEFPGAKFSESGNEPAADPGLRRSGSLGLGAHQQNTETIRGPAGFGSAGRLCLPHLLGGQKPVYPALLCADSAPGYSGLPAAGCAAMGAQQAGSLALYNR